MDHLHSNVLNNKSSTGNVGEDRSSPLLIWDSFSQKLCLFLLLLPPPNKTYSCYIFLDQTFWWKTKQKSQQKWKKTAQKIFLLCVEYFLHKSKRKWSQSWRTVVNRCAQKIPRSESSSFLGPLFLYILVILVRVNISGIISIRILLLCCNINNVTD